MRPWAVASAAWPFRRLARGPGTSERPDREAERDSERDSDREPGRASWREAGLSGSALREESRGFAGPGVDDCPAELSSRSS